MQPRHRDAASQRLRGRWRVWAPLAAVCLALLVGLAVPSATRAAPPAQDTAPNPPDAVSGQSSYMQNCAACHGNAGRGDGGTAAQLGFPPTAFADRQVMAGKTLAELFQVTQTGRMSRMMPPWSARLDDQEIWDTLAYAWTLHTSSEEVARGEEVYAANCASCHGADGKGKPPMLDLTDFTATSKVSQLTWVQVVAEGRGSMPGFGQKLSAANQAAVVEYIRTLSFERAFRAPLAEGSGVISGTVSNGTLSQPVSNITVTLRIFESMTPAGTRSTKTDASGLYRFDKLPTDADISYAVSTQYPVGAPYGSDIVTFRDGQNDLNLPLTVYEGTQDATGLRADRVHYIIEFDAGRLLVAELLVFSLDGQRAYLGDGQAVLHITLPAGAEDVSINEGEAEGRFEPAGDGFIDKLPIPPGTGTRQLLYRYSLPYDGSTLQLSRALRYPISNINALINDMGQKVISPQLIDQGPRQTQSGNYLSLSATNLPANQPIALDFSNLPSAAAGAEGTGATGNLLTSPGLATSDRTLLIILGLVFGAGAAVVATIPIMRRQGALAKGNVAGDEPRSGGTTREELVEELAELERAHAEGVIADGPFRERRLRLKAELADLLQAAGRGSYGR